MTSPVRELARVFVTLGISLAGLTSGCTSTPAPPSAATNAEWVDARANLGALKARMEEFPNRFRSEVGRAADEIAARSGPPVDRRALEWKVEAIALCEESALRPDPLGALLDTWCLCVQMREYLAGPGGERLEEYRAAALDAARRVEAEIEEVARTVVPDGDLTGARQLVMDSATQYPIEGALYTRISPVMDHADLVADARSLQDVAANLNHHVSALSQQVRLQTAQLPQEVGWQLELFLNDDLARLSTAVDRISRVVEELPELVRDERMAMAATVAAERQALLEAIDGQRRETIREVSRERLAVIESIREERLAVVESMNQTVEATLPRFESLIDHFFVRLLQVLVLVGLVLILGGLGLRALMRSARKLKT